MVFMMQTPQFFQKNIAILGLGVEGQSVVKFLQKNEAKITVFDEKQTGITDEIIQNLKNQGVKYLPGLFPDLSGFDLVVVSPGIRPDIPVLLNAKAKNIPVTNATNIFMELAPCKTIGVTGTKGKGTTSTLIYEMLKANKMDAYLGGNIGLPPLEFLDKLTPESVVVLELSSFQTFTMTKSPNIVVILMVTSEHLDYHKDTDEYILAKANLLRHQTHEDQIVVNVDYPNSKKIGDMSGKDYWQVSTNEMVKHGVCVIGDSIQFINGNKHQDVVISKDIYIPGRHNLENVGAAVATGKIIGIPVPIMRRVITSFKGLIHRIEFVREIGGVRFYDDSFSTTPETAIAAINAFSEPKILILGGSSKNSDFTELGNVIRNSRSIRAIIGIGEEWKRIKTSIKGLESRIKVKEGCNNMKEIIDTVKKLSKPGDVVLLSPACASFGMFKNYKDRGEQFKKCINDLINN
jgi:UDP-N-acetylmuramoylalanine--D-glutamate ligase